MTIADTLRQLGLASPDPRSDGELVSRFVANRDEPAFVELFRRHGSTVYGVCRRVLGNTPDADDAFQAVFLVLARSAASVRPPGMVGNWLYGVAVRTANKVRVMNAKRVNRRRESAGGLDQYPAVHTAGSPDRDTLAVIDAELAALPDMYRAAFVTCELNGRSRAEASRELGWPEGTVAARLAKARELLAVRLTERGVTLGAGLFAAVAVPPATATETISAVRELLSAGTASAVAPAAQTLSDEVVKSMTTNHAKWLFLAGLVLTLASGGAIVLGHPADPPPVAKAPAPKEKEQPMEWKDGKPIIFDSDPYGDRITGVAFSPDAKFIALAVGEQVRLLDATTRKQVNEHALTAKAPATVTALAFSPKGDKLAMTARDFVFIYSDLGKSPSVSSDTSWKMDRVDPIQVIWPADHWMVATNGVETWVREEIKGKWVSVHSDTENGKHGRPLTLAPLSGNTGYLASGRWEKEANDLHVVPTSLVAASPNGRLIGHKSRPVAVASAADGKRIVSAEEGGTIIVWEGEKLEFKEKRRIELGEGVVQLALAADGKTVAVVRRKEEFIPIEWPPFQLELLVFDVTDPPVKPKPIWSTVLKSRGFSKGPVSLAFSPDGKTLLAAFADPYINDKDAKSMGVKVWELVPKK